MKAKLIQENLQGQRPAPGDRKRIHGETGKYRKKLPTMTDNIRRKQGKAQQEEYFRKLEFLKEEYDAKCAKQIEELEAYLKGRPACAGPGRRL